MPTMRLTDNRIERVTPPDSGRVELWDTEVRGLGLRVTAKGARSFTYLYRHQGKQSRVTLGRYPDQISSLAEARRLAIEQAKSLAYTARQPFPEVSDSTAPLLREVYDEWMSREVSKRSWEDRRSKKRLMTNDVLPLLGEHRIDAVRQADIMRVIDGIEDRGAGVSANRCRSYLHRLFEFALERGLYDGANPVQRTKKRLRERPRERVLNDRELAAVWTGAKSLGAQGDAVRVLLLTGQRLGEVTQMRWAELDEHHWSIAAERTKARRAHVVPLPPTAREIVESQPRRGPFVFSTKTGNAFGNWGRLKQRLDDKARVFDWRLHDLRRTASTNLGRLGISWEVIEHTLNHTTGIGSGVAMTYNRHNYLRQSEEALLQLEGLVLSLLD